jgi:uncharacterized membrane protein
MSHALITVLAFVSALGTGLMAGTFFAFSTFVMGALRRLPAKQGIAAMQSINIVVINPIFLGTMMGTGLICVVLPIIAALSGSGTGAACLWAGSLLYLVGAVLVTMVFNVPRNNALARLDAGQAEAATLWERYLSEWTLWNHVRTAAALAASAAFILALRLPVAE